MSILHPAVVRAAAGELPVWAVVDEPRRAHMERVADALAGWAEALGLDEIETGRWRSVGYLHDALRDADPAELRERVPPAWRSMPGAMLHGPAAAERLRVDGVEDGELLLAVAYHTLGHPRFQRLGRALYAADFLDPCRELLPERSVGWRGRLPGELDEVVLELVAARVSHLLERRVRLHPETVGFWNALSAGA